MEELTYKTPSGLVTGSLQTWLSVIIETKVVSVHELRAAIGPEPRMQQALAELVAEGFLQKNGGRYSFR